MSPIDRRKVNVVIGLALFEKVQDTIRDLDNYQDVVTVARAAAMMGMVDENTAAELIVQWETMADGNAIVHGVFDGNQELSDQEIATIREGG